MSIHIGLSKRFRRPGSHQSAFVLPTVLVLSVVLLTLGLSVFQLTSSIARSLTDQYWQRLAVQATQAGVSYMSACVDQGLSGSTWPVSITQDNTCLGVALGTQPTLNTSYTSATDNSSMPNPYKSRFTIYKPITGLDGIPKARVVGAVDLQSSADNNGNRTTIKTITYEMTAIINGPTRASSQISLGRKHSCALSDGQVYCWGTNSVDAYNGGTPDNTLLGQLGRGATFTSPISAVPSSIDTSGVLSGKTITAISAGYNFACAIASGEVYCWGDNSVGQLGNNSTTKSYTPVKVDVSVASSLKDKKVTAISAGGYHACAIASGKVYCWGGNWYGQVGDNTTFQRSIPVTVNTAGSTVMNGKVTGIGLGAEHSCAIADGKAACWGYNANGAVGDGSWVQKYRPVNVSSGDIGVKTVTAISGGLEHTCAVASGAAYCWGYNNRGQLGNNSTTKSNTPVTVNASVALNSKVVTDISASSEDFSCAIANSAAHCWGANYFGQLGNNGTSQSNVPVAVSNSGVLSGKAVTSIAIGYYHACTIAGGQVYCWGHGSQGQLGDAKFYDTVTSSEHDALVPIKSINTF